MKYFFPFVFLLIFLSSCFGIGSSESTDRGLTLVSQNGIEIESPSTWETLESTDLPSAKNGELVYAAASPAETNGYLNNILILKSETSVEDVGELMKANIKDMQANLETYEQINLKDVSFLDGTPGQILIFEGKYNALTPTLTYMQTLRVCENQQVLATISLGGTPEDFTRYEYILESLACK